MKFFHVYNEDCFPGLIKNGMINRDTGLKIQHCFAVPTERQFHQIARVGGPLYALLKENRFPFYIDRLAGGITYYPYSFDHQLVQVYQDLLGDDFLGFQLHESGSNIRDYDWPQVQNSGVDPHDAAALARALKKDTPATDGSVLYDLSHGTPSNYAAAQYPASYMAFSAYMEQVYAARMQQTSGNILPVDSYHMFTRVQNELGMQVFMPEVGFQIPFMRQQVALARGIARSSGKKWGVYYECWRVYEENGSYLCCMPCYNTDPINEWYLTQQTHPDDFTTHGKNGGSSRRLQNRIYHYALMSGAAYFSEEWGLNCSYTDMHDFTLSPYGQVKKDFIRMAEGVQNVHAVTPFAIILPRRYSCMELPKPIEPLAMGVRRSTYLGSRLDLAEREYFGHIEDVLKLFFGQNGPIYGNEGHVITNSSFGDVADILYEDTPPEVLRRYRYLIDATQHGDFARSTRNSGLTILESGDLDQLAHTLRQLIPQAMPVSVDGLHWLVSETADGRRFLSIFNNEGNDRSSEHGDVIDPEAAQRVTITFRTPHALRIFRAPESAPELTQLDEGRYALTVPAADFVILEY